MPPSPDCQFSQHVQRWAKAEGFKCHSCSLESIMQELFRVEPSDVTLLFPFGVSSIRMPKTEQRRQLPHGCVLSRTAKSCDPVPLKTLFPVFGGCTLTYSWALQNMASACSHFCENEEVLHSKLCSHRCPSLGIRLLS